jgi:uncharacterized delta-60 repeat protein
VVNRSRGSWLVGLAVAFVANVCLAPTAIAASGDADSAFSGDGFAFADQTASGYDSVGVVAMAAEPDGGIVAIVRSATAGYYYSYTYTEHVVRFNADGSIDRGFGDNGNSRLPTQPYWQAGNEGIAVQSTGRILVSGITPGEPGDGLSVLALTPQGALDTTFGGGDGLAVEQVSPDSVVRTNRVAVGHNDTIVLAGVQNSTEAGPTPSALVVGRLLPDGDPDPSFSGDGEITLTSLGTIGDEPSSLDVDDAGRVVVTTVVSGGGTPCQCPIAAIRLASSGDLDPTYSEDGIATVDTPGVPGNPAAAVDWQGRVLVLATPIEYGPGSALTRFTAQGEVDDAFGTNGTVGLAGLGILNGYALASRMVVDASDRPILLGDSGPTLGRLTQMGSRDSAFPFESVYPVGVSSTVAYSLLRAGQRIYVGGRAAMRPVDQYRPYVFRATLDQSGAPDRDGDGAVDGSDPCPYVYGACPTIPRQLVLLFTHRFRILSAGAKPSSECSLATAIDIYKRRRGPDRLIKRLPAGSEQTHLAHTGGTIYAKAPAITLDTGICPKSRSKAIFVPAP